MLDKVARKVFGGGKLRAGGWYLGPGRARDLADYATSLFDASIAPIMSGYSGSPLEDVLQQEAAIFRADLESKVLSWEDESLGPETGLGVPFAEGAGAKSRYTRYIDNWVRGLVTALRWKLNPTAHDASAGSVEGISKGPSRFTPGSGAWNVLSRAQGLPPGTRSLQDKIADNAEYMRRADIVADEYPDVLSFLRKQFIRDALELVEAQGLEAALVSLRNQLDSIQAAGQRKGQD